MMTRYLQSLGLALALLLTSVSSHAAANELMIQLQHMRLASIGVMTDFFMYTGLDGDSKYGRRMNADMESFNASLAQARENVASQELISHLNDIEQEWLSFTQSLNSNRNLVENQGFPSVQMVDELGRLNNALVTRISAAYHQVAGVSDTNPAIEKVRDMAMLLQEMTTQYAASAAMDDSEVYLGEYKRTMQKMTSDFEFRLADLKAVAYQRSTHILMDNINSKWRFLRNSITRQHEMDVPFLVISYNDRIIRHLEELEGKIGS
jgi:hypothetical protein|tara:strand:- start:214 stop:1005 length:792 start_codon:yes stop_codon:yes gene_type:complete